MEGIIISFEKNKTFFFYIRLDLWADNKIIELEEKELIQFFNTLDIQGFKKKWITIFTNNLTIIGLTVLKSKKNQLTPKIYVDKGGVYSFRLESKKHIINIKGIENLIPFGINKLIGEGIKKEEKRYLKKTEKIIKNFNIEICYFIKNWKFICSSISSISLEIFKKNFDLFQKVKIGLTEKEDSLFRLAYHGSRNEVYGNLLKEEIIYYFDFPSMFGKVMEEDFAYGEWEHIKKPKEIKNNGIYLVSVSSKNMEIPVLPFRVNNSRLIFPNGDFEGWYYGEEISLFIQEGGVIKETKEAIVFPKKDKIFKDFSVEMQKKRNNGELQKRIFKSIIVSLYGRLGMSKRVTETKVVLKEEEYDILKKKFKIISETWIDEDSFVGIIEYEITEIEKRDTLINSNVFYAGAITAKARVLLFKAMKEVKENKGRVLYVDTDSIFAAFKKKIIEKNFKIIKWSDVRIIDCVFASTKMYSLKFKDDSWETRISGASRNSIKFEEFYKNFYLGKKKSKIELQLKKKSKFQITEEKIERFIKYNTYDKRKFDLLKKKTKAFVIVNNMVMDP